MKKNRWVFGFFCFVSMAIIVLFSDNEYNPRVVSSGYFFDKASQYYGREYDVEKAEKYFKWSSYINPKIPYAHYQLARIYLVQNDLERAKEEIDKELEIHPENKRAFYIRGLIDGYSRNHQEAQEDFKKFIKYSPDEWAGYMDLSWVYINDKKFKEAVETTDEGLEKFPDHIWLMANKGLALYKIGNYEEAKNILEKDKELAKGLTADDWKKAYPGNNPNEAEEGVKDIQGAISYNLALAYKNLDETEKYLKEVDYYQSLFSLGDSRRSKIFDTL